MRGVVRHAKLSFLGMQSCQLCYTLCCAGRILQSNKNDVMTHHEGYLIFYSGMPAWQTVTGCGRLGCYQEGRLWEV